MTIGEKLRNARTESNLTQEEIAESLGISRQTVSNWENDKSYPDIVSVVKLSDLYSISLDVLLKEENKMSNNYLNYLKESTDVVRTKKNVSKTMKIVAFVSVWAIMILAFWFSDARGNAMGYALSTFYLILPAMIFLISLLFAKDNDFGKFILITPIIFGVMYMLAEYSTFSLLNMVSFKKFNMPDFGMILGGGLQSLIGLLIGKVIRKHQLKKTEKAEKE